MAAERFLPRVLPTALGVLVMATTLTACKTMPEAISNVPFIGALTQKTPGPLEPLPPPAPRAWPDSRQDVINQRARGYGLVNAPEARVYLNRLYGRVKAAAGVPDWPGEVHISAQSPLHAFATAAGNIYITLPWLTSVQSEDEIVALLAHEFGHIYLHFHQLEGAVEIADTTAGVLAIGVALAGKTAQAAGWTQVDSLAASYAVGRLLATALYSQSEEVAADRVSLHLVHKLGYSYEHGPKAFLERLAGWEEQHGAETLKKQEDIKKAVRERTLALAAKQAPVANNELSAALNNASAELKAGINVGGTQFMMDLNQALGKIASTHPETLKRQDTLAQLADATPELQADRPPVTAPLNAMRSDRRTAQILKNYALAYQALESPASAEALGWARQAATGPTATHAVPLHALYTVANSQTRPVRGFPPDLTQLLDPNINSENDRAWFSYMERSNRLKQRGRRAEAAQVLERGMTHFAQAQEIMPFAVVFYGETVGWAKAKETAQDCARRFPKAAKQCNDAARSPAEVAAAQQQDKQKAEQFMNKFLKKP